MARKKELEEEKKVKTTKKSTKATKSEVKEVKNEETKKAVKKSVSKKKVEEPVKKTSKTTKKVSNEEKVVKRPRVKKEEVVEEEKVVTEAMEEEKIADEEPKKRSIFGVLLIVFGIALVVLAFIVSIIETNEKTKYYNSISFSEVDELINDSETNIIYWASPTCSYCTQFKPIIMDVSNKYEVTFNYLNVSNLGQDEYATMYTHFIEYDATYESENLGTPSLILFKDGKIEDISVGLLTEEELVTYLQDKGLISE